MVDAPTMRLSLLLALLLSLGIIGCAPASDDDPATSEDGPQSREGQAIRAAEEAVRGANEANQNADEMLEP